MAEDEDRYGYLLNPIKDLQKNWDVNLENILSGYLQELSNLADQVELGLLDKKRSVLQMNINGLSCCNLNFIVKNRSIFQSRFRRGVKSHTRNIFYLF